MDVEGNCIICIEYSVHNAFCIHVQHIMNFNLPIHLKVIKEKHTDIGYPSTMQEHPQNLRADHNKQQKNENKRHTEKTKQLAKANKRRQRWKKRKKVKIPLTLSTKC